VEKLKDCIFYLQVAENDGRVCKHLALGRFTIDWGGPFTALKHGLDDYGSVEIGGWSTSMNSIRSRSGSWKR